MFQLTLDPGALTLSILRRAYQEPVRLDLTEASIDAVKASRQALYQRAISGERVYGVNTGFGRLARSQISADQVHTLQLNLILSHMAGVGPLLDDAVVRLILLLKVNGLAQGFSGVRLRLIESLSALLAAEVYPCIPSKGSVGASGDLAPLAHLSAVLLGRGQVRHQGEMLDGARGLEIAGIEPIVLHAKEGLALINGTQVSTALALHALFQTEDLFAAAILAGCMTLEAALGSHTPFDERIHAIRGQQGQIDVARACRELLHASPLNASHASCDRVQDPYSLRCIPQVLGAALELIRNAAHTLEVEANAVSDNPLVFADTGHVLSGGNFHAEPVAMAADILAIAIAEIGAFSERRIALLIDESFSSLPPFLTRGSGLNSGFMIPQVTAAALASENKTLAHPASVDSLPTSANQEDFVSMATFAARRLLDMADNTSHIVGIELLAAAQGLDLRAPLVSSEPLMRVHAMIRERVPVLEDDRPFSPDMNALRELIGSSALTPLLPSGLLR